MAESFSKASDIKKMMGKHVGEEEPIVVAQRFLNIFRQLHIFNTERRDAFNNMILELPSDVRGMFGALPGGSVLQEYVDELEHAAGMNRDSSNIASALSGDSTHSNMDEEISKAKILATALAEAQIQAAAKLQAAAPMMSPQPMVSTQPIMNGPSKEEQIEKLKTEMTAAKKNNDTAKMKELQKAYQDLQKEPVLPQAQMMAAPSGPVKIVADADFAKEIASAFVEAMQYSEKQRQNETTEITQAIKESQLEMAKILKSQQENNSEIRHDEASRSDNTELLTKADAQEITQAIKESQIEIAKIFAQSQKNIPIVTANGTTEVINRNDNGEIAQAIKDSQLEVAKMLMQHNAINASSNNNANANANTIQINNAPTFPPIEELMNGIVKAQMEMFKEVSRIQTQELSSIISLALKESQQLSTQTIIEAVTALQKENAKLFEMQAQQKPQIVIQEKIVREEAPYREENRNHSKESFSNEASVIVPDKSIAEPSVSLQPETEFVSETDSDIFLDEISEASNTPEESSRPKKKKKNKNKNKNKNNLFFGSEDKEKEFIFGEGTKAPTEAEDSEWNLDFEEEAKPAENNLLDISLFDTSDNLIEKKKPVIDIAENISEEELFAIDDDLDTQEDTTSTSESTDVEIDVDIESLSKETSPKTNPEDDFAWLDEVSTSSEKTDEEDDEWDWNEIEKNIDDIQEAKLKKSEASTKDLPFKEEYTVIVKNDEQEWEWEEVEEETETQQPVMQTTASTFEEPTEEIIEEVSRAVENDEQEWEWEEVEEETETQQPVMQMTASTFEEPTEEIIEEVSPAVENDEQEWEWEEVEEETETQESVMQMTASTFEEPTEEIIEEVSPAAGNDEQEWEWEYEEDDDTASSITTSSEQAPTSEAADGEEEWEWEYEEEDNNAVPVQAELDTSMVNPHSETSDGEDEEWEWEYEEDDTLPAVETAAEQAPNSENPNSEDEEWEWEYEEDDTLPASDETETTMMSADEDSDNLSLVQGEAILKQPADPYKNDYALSSDKSGEPEENMANIYTGDLYFQKDVYAKSSTSADALDNKEPIVPEIVISELSDSDNKDEPYSKNNDVK